MVVQIGRVVPWPLRRQGRVDSEEEPWELERENLIIEEHVSIAPLSAGVLVDLLESDEG
jgi:hypothetical protein